MSGFKDKIQIFSLGLMLGLLIGGGFFILKLDNYFSKLSFYKTTPQENIASAKDISTSSTVEKPPLKKGKTFKAESNTNPSALDSLQQTSINANNQVNSLVLKDSLTIDSIGLSAGSDNIVVRKDELLSMKSMDVINLSPTASRNGKDSVLLQLTGIRENSGKTSYKIEFWQSPLNYKGYKMTKNKILLYGINPEDAVKLYKLDESIYLKYSFSTYRLDYTSDFKQFERVVDEGVLARLK